MNFLNASTGYTLFELEAIKDTYVDKTYMLDTLYRYREDMSRCVCVTRGRRFGKTLAANRIGAFFRPSVQEQRQRLFERFTLGALREEQCGQWEQTRSVALCWPQQGKIPVIHLIDWPKDEILSAMVVYGFLTYYEGKLRIPNYERTLQFQRALAPEPLGDAGGDPLQREDQNTHMPDRVGHTVMAA